MQSFCTKYIQERKEKKMKRNLLLLAALAAAVVLFSCDVNVNTGNNPNPNPNPNPSGTPDFDNHYTDNSYSILVRNGTNQRLVAFKNELSINAMIGGILPNANNHGLPKDPALWTASAAITMILITEAQFNANKSNLNALRYSPFTRVSVFYNHGGDNSKVYEIDGSLGGPNELRVINDSRSIDVELRVGGPAGPTLGYAPSGMIETNFKMNDGNYIVCPVFRRYNQARDLWETVYPQGTGSGTAWSYSFSFGEGHSSEIMNLKTQLQNTSFSTGAAWVYILNQTTSGGVRFMEGTNYIYRTATGLEQVAAGTPRTFQVNMPNVGNNFATSMEVTNWRFGPPQMQFPLQKSSTDTTELGSKTIEAGKMYTIVVTGDYNNDGRVRAWISAETDINADELGGQW
jgi:hypothetical protein